MRRIHLFAPDPLIDRLRAAARAKGVSLGEYVRAAPDACERLDRERLDRADPHHRHAA